MEEDEDDEDEDEGEDEEMEEVCETPPPRLPLPASYP